ncbi:MAG: helix-turn-helix domain-containing protein [Burkholderiales bacterium]|nr:helix-turn-helix domain-containing protein [Burkholderiales bacterium]
MYIQASTHADTSRYAPMRTPIARARNDADWSSLKEVMDLLRFDGNPNAMPSDSLFRRRRVRSGQSVFAMGQPFGGLYVVRLGSLKSVVTHDDGSENVVSFSMKGDLLGTDGVCNNRYWCEAVALTDCEVVRLPDEGYFSPGRGCNEMERMLYWAVSREMAKEQAAYAVSHAAKSEVRVARFLLMQAERFAAMGCSPRRFTLAMTRRDIGSFLSVTLETVSRALSVLNHLGIIEVSNRDITIVSAEALKTYEG